MDSLIHLATHGLDCTSLALSVNRIAMGTFFAISGYHKLFNRARHASVEGTLAQDHIPHPEAMSWVVPSFELTCGLSLFVGLLSPLASVALIVICTIATCTDGIKRIPSWNPIDFADKVDDILYLPEVLYMVSLMIVLLAGPGSLSVDNLI